MTDNDVAEVDASAEQTSTPPDASSRRNAELASLLNEHLDRVRKIHKMYPVGDKPFGQLSDAEQRNWAERQKAIGIANLTYHRAVSTACIRHRSEDLKASAALHKAMREDA